MIKELFKKLLPTLRVETGCSLSVGAAFLFLAYGGHHRLPQFMSELWRRGDTAEGAFLAVLAALGMFALALPFLSLVFGAALHRRFAVLNLAFSVLVLICALGWSADDAFRSMNEGPHPFGIPVNIMIGTVALLELAILIYGGMQLLDDRPLLMTLMGFRRVDGALLGVNLAVTTSILILCRKLGGVSSPEAALLALHFIFGMTWLRTRLQNSG